MRKLLFAMLLMQSCVTINVCEKPKLACVISDKHDCGKAVYADAPSGFQNMPYYAPKSLPSGSVTPCTKVPNLTYPILHNCDTTFKN